MPGITRLSAIRLLGGAGLTTALTVTLCWSASAAPQERSDDVHEFDRAAAIAFADAHYDDGPHWLGVDDCTYFASEVLKAGDLPETGEWNDATTDPTYAASSWRIYFGAIPTKAYMGADFLKNYLVDNDFATITQIDPTQHLIPGAEPGDLVAYSWDNTGVINHIAVVSDNTDETQVDQHEPNAQHKGYNWSMEANEWLTQAKPNVAVYLIHITW